MLPLVIPGDNPVTEIKHPMAVVITGGMITSTVLTLFVTPSMYWHFGALKRKSAVPVLVPALNY